MKVYTKIHSAVVDFVTAWNQLKFLGVITTKKDFTCQLAEYMVVELYNGKLASNSVQKEWDIVLEDGRKVQVKSHAKASTNPNRWSPVPYKEDASIDLFIIVVFTEDYKLKHFFEVPWKELFVISNEDKARRLIRWNKLKQYDKLKDHKFLSLDLIKRFV